MSVLISQKYEFLPTLGVTVGYHKLKMESNTDSITVRPLETIMSARVVGNETVTSTACASQITFSTAQAAVDDTVTVGGIRYTFKAAAAGASFQVAQGATAAASATNLFNAVNGTTTGFTANPLVIATNPSSGVVQFASRMHGPLARASVTPCCVFATAANIAVNVLPGAASGATGLGVVATVASAAAGVVALSNPLVASWSNSNSEVITLITYHSANTPNYTSIG